MLRNKTSFVQINLELRTLNIVVSSYFSVSLRVLYKVLTALSLAIQTARLWRGEPGGWTAGPGRLRQLELLPTSNHCLWNRWTLRCFLRCVKALKTETLLRLFPLLEFMLRLDHEINYCKTIMVCNEWCSVVPIYYVSQKCYSWDCDVWHNRRHLDLKIWVLTSCIRAIVWP